MNRQRRLTDRRTRRAWRVRGKVRGTSSRPRISVIRTGKHFWLQLVDDEAGRTLCAASSKGLGVAKGWGVPAAKAVGEDLGKKAAALGVKEACFDRGPYRYHGRVKALADGAREGGLQF